MNDQVPLEEIARAFCARRRLTFVEKVGEGAFKQTFRVVDGSGISVALKLYKPEASSRRSNREVEAMAKCNHPNIAKLFSVESFSHKGSAAVVTLEEFLPGGTLGQRGSIDVATCLTLGSQLIDAVAHIAAANLVHRDLKPDNIMFRADRAVPVIVDFGVVRNLIDTSLTPSWAPRGPGTPYFAAPEQLNNEKHQIDWRADQFSLGVVLAFVTAGEHPYQGLGFSPGQVVDRVAARETMNPEFARRMQGLGLPALVAMVSPWAVQRYRTPQLLRDAWTAQGG